MKSIKNYITEAVSKQISESENDLPQVKLYDSGDEGYPDRYTLYFPYPQWLKEESNNIEGTFLGCSPANFGGRMTRCTFDMVESGQEYDFGKEIPLRSMPQKFQEAANELISKWYDALKYNDEQHWDAWDKA